MTTDILFVDGTWTRPNARSAAAEAFRHAVDGRRFRFVYVDYPGSYGPATGFADVSLEESVRRGVQALAAAVAGSSNRAVVGGYSQGAMVAVRFCRDILPHRPDLIVDACATLGDPHQPVHVGRAGIAGPVTVTSTRRLAVYALGDPIADLPLGSPLRSIADMSRWMSVRSPEAGERWARETLAAVPTRLQRWWEPWRWPDLASAGAYADAYLNGTAHGQDYVTGGHARRLARLIEQQVPA